MSKEKLQTNKELLVDSKLFSCFKKRTLLDPSLSSEFLEKPPCSIVNLFEEKEGFDTKFVDLEEITYFFDFSSVNPLAVDELRFCSDGKGQKEGWLAFNARMNGKNTTIGEQLKELNHSGRKITHIVRSTEKYGGTTNTSVWRNYLEAQIYEVENPDSFVRKREDVESKPEIYGIESQTLQHPTEKELQQGPIDREERSINLSSTPTTPRSLEAARRIVASQLAKQHLEELDVPEHRLEDVARWLEEGLSVKVYYAEPEWKENGINDDITYGGLVIEPVFPKK